MSLFDFKNAKRINGQYFTEHNPFINDGFLEWSMLCKIKTNNVLELFAGKRHQVNRF
jgi:hypothetical protein